jgi:hypothetical protein
MGLQVNMWWRELRGVKYKSCIEIETQVENMKRVKNQKWEERGSLFEFLEKQKKLVKVLTKQITTG